MIGNDTGSGLSRNQKRFVTCLLKARSVAEACKLAHVSEATAWRWLRLDSVQHAASEAQDALLAEATRSAVSRMTSALDTLASIMADNGYSASARVSAARAILESGLRFTELVTLAERVAILEQRMVSNGH